MNATSARSYIHFIEDTSKQSVTLHAIDLVCEGSNMLPSKEFYHLNFLKQDLKSNSLILDRHLNCNDSDIDLHIRMYLILPFDKLLSKQTDADTL